MKLNEAGSIEKLFRLSKASCTNKKPAEQLCLGLKEHYQTHFTHPNSSEEPPDEISNTPEFIKQLTESGISTEEDIEHWFAYYTHSQH